MFIKAAQHPVHYVFGSISHAPLVFQAWALEDFSYKMRWLALYMLSLGILTGTSMGLSAGVFVGVCVLFVTGFMALPSFMGTKGQGDFCWRFSIAYGNAILAWHGFFITFYLYMAMFVLSITLLSFAWTRDLACVFFAGISMIYLAFSLQMAASTTKGVPQWVVPFVSVLGGGGMYAFMSWSTASL